MFGNNGNNNGSGQGGFGFAPQQQQPMQQQQAPAQVPASPFGPAAGGGGFAGAPGPSAGGFGGPPGFGGGNLPGAFGGGGGMTMQQALNGYGGQLDVREPWILPGVQAVLELTGTKYSNGLQVGPQFVISGKILQSNHAMQSAGQLVAHPIRGFNNQMRAAFAWSDLTNYLMAVLHPRGFTPEVAAVYGSTPERQAAGESWIGLAQQVCEKNLAAGVRVGIITSEFKSTKNPNARPITKAQFFPMPQG